MSKVRFQRILNIATYVFFFEADGVGRSGRKHMGNDMHFWDDLFLCAVLIFSNHCLAMQLINTFLCLSIPSVELDSVILPQNTGVLEHFSDILNPFTL